LHGAVGLELLESVGEGLLADAAHPGEEFAVA
jgi:hypothetical protein